MHFVLVCIILNVKGGFKTESQNLIYFTDMRSFDCLIGWQAHEGEVCSIQFSADETTAYSMGTDGKVRNITWK